MLRKISIFVLFLLLLDKGFAETCNEPNTVFSTCGPICPATCAGPSANCPEGCFKGCVCAPGFVLGPEGTCVHLSECAPQCGSNEVHSNCAPSCPETCAIPEYTCLNHCTTGCKCLKGMVRDEHGNCIPRAQCPPQCPRNEVYTPCGSACPKTCSDPQPKCAAQCFAGCVCDADLVRDELSGKCIAPTACPPLSEITEWIVDTANDLVATLYNVLGL